MGPLDGVKIIELAGIGPVPMCAMLLADMGATVLRINREGPTGGTQRPLQYDLRLRNRETLTLNLKDSEAVKLVLRLVEQADALIEGYRPGVTERLGLGPEACLARNKRLVYGRMTGWGQNGPLAKVAGHDINYIAITGALHAIGRKGQLPATPLNLVGDMGGGALYLTMGLLAGIMSARSSGHGQVVDAAIVDGAASMMTSWFGLLQAGGISTARGTNATDSGAFYYDVYECKDGGLVSIGTIEPHFYSELLKLLEIDPASMPAQNSRVDWAQGRKVLEEKFKTKSRDEWTSLLEGRDVCFAPVLDMKEAPRHPHLKARGTFLEIEGVVQPAPAPRFSRTPLGIPTPPRKPNPQAALTRWLTTADISGLQKAGIIKSVE